MVSEFLSNRLSFIAAPDTVFEYSNLGYAILGRVITEVAGMPYHDVVRSRLLEPLGMTQSTLDISDVPNAVRMQGYRRVDEWHLIERAIDNFDVVFLRNEDAVAQMGRGRLTREELAILELVNGKNTVKDIVRKSRVGSFDVSKMLYRLLSIKLVRRRVLPIAI